MLFLLAYLLGILYQIFLPCYCGSLIADLSADLVTDLYRSAWIGRGKRVKTIMLEMMERAKRPIVMTVYMDLADIQLTSFVRVKFDAISAMLFK